MLKEKVQANAEHAPMGTARAGGNAATGRWHERANANDQKLKF